MQHAALGTSELACNVSQVTGTIAETSGAATQVLTVSADLSDRAQELNTVVQAFLKQVAA